MPDISHFIHGKIFSPGSFEQDWFTNKGFSHEPPLGVPPGPLQAPKGYNYKFNPLGLGNWLICNPDENLKVLAQKVKN